MPTNVIISVNKTTQLISAYYLFDYLFDSVVLINIDISLHGYNSSG